MFYENKTQAQTLRSVRDWRKKRKCSFYALLLKNGANLSYRSRVHIKLKVLWRSLELDCGTSESKHSWKEYRNISINFRAQSSHHRGFLVHTQILLHDPFSESSTYALWPEEWLSPSSFPHHRLHLIVLPQV